MESQEITNLTKDLIKFESIESRPDELRRVVDFVADYLEKNTKLSVKRFEHNGKPSLVGLFNNASKSIGRGSLKLPKIFLHDHLDVVPGNPSQFKPTIKGDELFGRGASDTKANGAVLMILARELSKSVDIPPVGFMFTTDEEIGGGDGTKYLLEKGYTCEFFLTCEPTHFDIVPAHKGVLWIEVKVKGQAAHSSRPWAGKNAALLAYEGLAKLYKLYPLPKQEAWKTTVNVGGIVGGDAFNKVMPECKLKLDIRFIEKDEPEKIVRDVRACFPGSEVKVVQKESMMNTKADDPWVKRLAASVEKITGKKPDVRRGHGACDGRFYSAVGIPAVEFGTVSKGLHTDEECVKISTLKTFYEILFNFVSHS